MCPYERLKKCRLSNKFFQLKIGTNVFDADESQPIEGRTRQGPRDNDTTHNRGQIPRVPAQGFVCHVCSKMAVGAKCSLYELDSFHMFGKAKWK